MLYPVKYIRQRGVFVSLLISVKGFSRAWFSMSKTGLTLEPKYRIYSFDNQTREYGNIMK